MPYPCLTVPVILALMELESSFLGFSPPVSEKLPIYGLEEQGGIQTP